MHLTTHAQMPEKTFNMNKKIVLAVVCGLCISLVGCASKPQVRTGPRYVIVPETYIVKAGDSLSAIAARYGMDYTKVAANNNIAPPYRIYVNQRIRLKSSALGVAPIQTQTLSPVAEVSRQKVDLPNNKAVSESPQNAIVTKSLPNPVINNTVDPSLAAVQSNIGTDIRQNSSTDLMWVKPTAGLVIQGFEPSKNIKGLRFGGQTGDAIFAAANGEVFYADNGLKEYGNLVLIKHADGYITAYAHNSKLLVKKGEKVTAGQKIAEMGSTGSAIVMLEFQVRLNGKPIDPQTVLSLN